MDKYELYSNLTCALTHNLSACDGCKKCGNNSAEARLNLIKELANYMNIELPFKDDKDYNFTYNNNPVNDYDFTISKINSWDNYKLPDDYDFRLNKINDWSNYKLSDSKDFKDYNYSYEVPNKQENDWNFTFPKKDK